MRKLQIRAFFRDVPIPVDAYPLIGIVVVMCSGATYSTLFFIFSRIYRS